MDSNTLVELLAEQGQNVLKSMKDLNRQAKKAGRERTALFERYIANRHSFNVYTYANEELEQKREVQNFQEKLNMFDDPFEEIKTNFDAVIDVKKVQPLYDAVFTAYNEMVIALGFENKIVNEKQL